MATKLNTGKWNSCGPVTLSLLLLAVFVMAIDTKVGEAISSFVTGNNHSLALRSKARNQALADERSSEALIDAVMSIVQSYYVDTDRVENSYLVEGALKSLAFAIPEAQLEQDVSSWTLKVQGNAVSIAKDPEMTYEVLIYNIKILTKFCNQINLADFVSPAGSMMLGTEKSPATLVLNAVLSSLDAHSSLMSPDGYKDLRQGTDGSFGGLGVLVGVKNHQLTVLKPMPRSPALRMGIKKNDRIVAIDGFSTFGLSLDQLVSHMRGEPGSTARLSILREDSASPMAVNVPREIIEVDSVETRAYHKGHLHYLHLTIDSFAARTGREVASAIRSFKMKYPLSGVILDLRSNPGGLLDQAVEVSDVFLKEGLIVSTTGRRDEVERASVGRDELDFPLVVLMNEDSASASEIVAGALQDNGRAVVVGQPSFGKGSVQTLFELPSERALKLTIARYLTPSGRSIQNTGIMPDVWVQPVRAKSENKNLFGPYRYRSEAFLPNHLSPINVGQERVQNSPVVKGFYLRSSEVQDSEDPKTDLELSLAETIIAKSHSLYGNHLPESARRSSHILAVSLNELRQKVNEKTLETSNWLKKTFNLTWSDGSVGGTPNILLELPTNSLSAVAGKSIKIPWTIKNISSTPAYHVSVFVQSPISGIDTAEFLVGDIAADSTVQGVLNLDLPAELSAGSHRLVSGVAVEGIALDAVMKEFSVSVKQTKQADVLASISFEDGAKSMKSGVLDPNESGFIHVKLTNTTDLDLTDLKVEVVNLAGSQVKVGEAKLSKNSIFSRESVDLKIPVTAGADLSEGHYMVGYVLRSEGLSGTLPKIAEFKAASGQIRQADNRLTH